MNSVMQINMKILCEVQQLKKIKKIYIMEMSCGSQVGGDIQQSPAHICSYQ